MMKMFDFIHFHDGHQTTHAIRKRCRKFDHMVVVGNPVRLVVVKRENIKAFPAGELALAIRSLRRVIERRGVTQAARKVLDEAEASMV